MKKRRFWLCLVTLLSASVLMYTGSLASRERERSVEQPDAEVVVERGIVYGVGDGVELKLDLAVPKGGAGPFPAIVCLHGGGWRGGKREDLAASIEGIAKRGYVAVTISYRLVPAAKFPAQIEDCKSAVRWLRANAPKYRINPDRIGAFGFSAGGHLACLLGLTRPQDGLEGKGGSPEQSSAVQAVVSFFGPTDLSARSWSKEVEENLLVPFLGASFDEDPEVYKKSSPVTYVHNGAPPFLFFHGTEDRIVSIRHSRLLADKLKEHGVEARLVEMHGEGHGWRGPNLTRSIEQTFAFFDEKLQR